MKKKRNKQVKKERATSIFYLSVLIFTGSNEKADLDRKT